MDENTSKTDLARRAVACKGWRWMPGNINEGATESEALVAALEAAP